MSSIRTTFIALLVLALTFASGVMVGAFGTRFLHRDGPFHEFAVKALVNRLDRQLDLTDDQRAKVQEIVARRHARINSFYGQMRRSVLDEIEDANREIEQILTPEQRVRYEKVKMHLRARHGERGRPRDREQKAPTR